MTTYFSYYWMSYLAQYQDKQTGDLRTFIAPTRQEAISKALQAIFNQ